MTVVVCINELSVDHGASTYVPESSELAVPIV